VLRTPKEVRLALVYVLANFKHHSREVELIDPHSSGRWFLGWEEPPPRQATPSPVAEPRTWLARVGWRRHGRIGFHEGPS
jgi:putative transposase